MTRRLFQLIVSFSLVGHVARASDALSDLLQRYAPEIEAAEKAEKETAKPKSNGHYVIQVAAFATEHEARALVTTLTKKGWSSSFTAALIAGRTWYRVNIGPFDDGESARSFQSENMTVAGLEKGIVKKLSESPTPVALYIAEKQK